MEHIKQGIYQACKYKRSLQCDPDKCHRSGKGLKNIRWHLVHTEARRNLSHSYRWRSRRCSHTGHRARTGWFLRVRRHVLREKQSKNPAEEKVPNVSHSVSPMLHSSLSVLQVLPIYPGGQLQLNMPLMGLVSHCEPSLHGLLIQASFLWQSKPERNTMLKRISITCFQTSETNKQKHL